MMAKIHELAEVLANQIAAGEVIERPASVVKELVENALDAHSTQIDIVVAEAGLKQIQVIDNGDGIAAEDVLNAFKRHATSKIHDRADLFKVRSLGFRGEALPSIASVSDMILETSTGEEVGRRVHFRGGKLVEEESSAVRQGTTVTVSDLFFNTPARLKYIKSPNTELANIGDIVNRLALSHPEVAFSLSHDGNILVRTAGNGQLQQTIAGIYGVNNAKKMLAISAEDLDFRLHGFVSLPELTRSSRRYITVMINGRYIKNFQLTKAIIAGYGSKLMVGRFPLIVLAIEMDPLLVDVNVHPAKQEVRLSKEDELGELIRKTIYARIASENLIPDANENLNSSKQKKADQLQMALNAASTKWPQTYSTTPEASSAAEPESAAQIAEQLASEPAIATTEETVTNFADQADLAAWDAKYQHEQVGPALGAAAAVTPLAQPAPAVERFPHLDYIGQMHGTYLLAQGEDGFYIVDQHAAQERVNYEYYRQEIGKVSTDQQSLLVPLVLDYPASDAIRLRDRTDLLQQLGLNLEAFGQNSFVVRSHPTWFKAGQEEDTIREMIDYILNDQKITVAKFREQTAIMMSCKRAIKANHHLDDQQAKALLQRLPECENPFNCPHGRPVLVHFSGKDLEKMFRRIQESHTSLRGEMA
ncbi:DNA mismatch repair protein [Loigolactobacillus coryniformis subsp. coryniformis KCTC 3167 = DSM 20001]|uniref:DNA mismatch repair protein MutL n=2 Tax=Loigolactobacillus coryniformis TaxID=1610 RepID=A0A0R1F7M2_9LACO|nr:DNA mismatch repair protein [Loigolactobacillus coryniformis subsp. coryniformis KCTC 3167 = DSM 20001]